MTSDPVAASLPEELKAAAHAFRLGLEALGNERLAVSIDQLLAILQTGRLSAHTTSLTAVLPELWAAQERGDFLYAADLLEYELLPFL
jgi:hypothetical protein